MLALLLLAVADPVDQFAPVRLDPLTLAEARGLDGRRVAVVFVVGPPVFTWDGKTVAGPDEQEDGVSRVVVLTGEHPEIDPGQKLLVTGRLRVIDHKGAVVGGKWVSPWTEIRVEQGK